MVKHYIYHAMGVKSGLKFRKRAMNHFYNTMAPVRKLVISGKGNYIENLADQAARTMDIKPRALTPIKFSF
jgi:hypothetical protein